jgi:hypothetical protein
VKEPTRLRDLISSVLYGKRFEDLTIEEKEKVHEAAIKMKSIC